MFNLDLNRIVEIMIHSLLRLPKQLSWNKSLVKPVKDLHLEFKTLTDDLLFKLRFTSQVIYLEHILNELFDLTNRGIFIQNIESSNLVVLHRKIEQLQNPIIFRKSEGKPGLLLRRREEFIGEFDFTVNVPSSVIFDENEMRALVNLYKLAGMRYEIIIF